MNYEHRFRNKTIDTWTSLGCTLSSNHRLVLGYWPLHKSAYISDMQTSSASKSAKLCFLEYLVLKSLSQNKKIGVRLSDMNSLNA